MHSSISLSLEPGLERGAPWGRDLYTFVTSAAGHMMRTLQKPRKNRPLKRQVNHRRFLHNMIQRKFADIEAANHRLASVLYFKGDDKTPDAPDPSLNASQTQPAEDKNTDNRKVLQKKPTTGSQNPESVRKTQPESTRKPRPKSRKSKKSDQKLLDLTSMETPPSETMPLYSDDSIPDALEETFLQFSPAFSELSLLSLDSCDFATQMFTDISSCTPTRSSSSIEEIAESQWAELIDLFHAGSSGRRVSVDVEEYLESICDCQSDAECGKDDEQEDVFFERAQCRYETDRAAAEDHWEQVAPLLTDDDALGMNSFTLSNSDIIQSEPPNSTSYQCMSYLQQSQNTGQCELNPLLFEGVAQSFSASSQSVPRFSIPTPPYEGDWLFTDILTDTAMSKDY